LLGLHMDIEKESNKKAVEKIVKEITSDICVHNYPIYRDEAKSLGLNVATLKDELEKLIWVLYEKYAQDMELTKHLTLLSYWGKTIH